MKSLTRLSSVQVCVCCRCTIPPHALAYFHSRPASRIRTAWDGQKVVEWFVCVGCETRGAVPSRACSASAPACRNGHDWASAWDMIHACAWLGNFGLAGVQPCKVSP